MAFGARRRTTRSCRPEPSWASRACCSGRRFRSSASSSLLRLGRRLPYRWRRGTREERFLRLACPYFAVALVGFTATCFFLNFAWLEPYYVLAAFVAALMGVIARRVKEQRMELHAAALRRKQPAPGGRRHRGEPVPVLPGQARYPRPLVMLPDGTAPARRPQFVVSGTDHRYRRRRTRGARGDALPRSGRLARGHLRHRQRPHSPVAPASPPARSPSPIPCVSPAHSRTTGGARVGRKVPDTSSRSARPPCLRSCRSVSCFPPGAIPWPGLETVRAICDKRRVLEAAPAFGIGVPRQVVLEACPRLRSLPELQLPRGRQAGSLRGRGGRCAPRSSVCATLRRRRNCSRCVAGYSAAAFPLLLQERVVGPGVGIFLLLWDGVLRATFAHRRLREKPPSGGVSVYRESIAADPDAGRALPPAARAFRLAGCCDGGVQGRRAHRDTDAHGDQRPLLGLAAARRRCRRGLPPAAPRVRRRAGPRRHPRRITSAPAFAGGGATSTSCCCASVDSSERPGPARRVARTPACRWPSS